MAAEKQIHDITIVRKKPGQEEEKDLEVHLKEEKLRNSARDTRTLFNAIQDELDNRGEDLKDGLSFLDLKNDTLLSYMIDVCNIVLRKVRGESIEGHPSVERCVEYRTILEKLKGIDQKLAYQLNKLITMPEDAAQEDHKIDINNLDIDIDNLGSDDGEDDKLSEKDDASDSNDDEDDDGDDDDDDEDDDIGDDDDDDDGGDKNDDNGDKKGKPGIYKPPKLRSVSYDQGGRRKNYDNFYQDEESGEIVEETRATVDKDRVRYEEDHYTRLSDKKRKKRLPDKKRRKR